MSNNATRFNKLSKSEKNKDFRCKCGVKLPNERKTRCERCSERNKHTDMLHSYWNLNGNNSQSKTAKCEECYNTIVMANNRDICFNCYDKPFGYLT